MKRLGASPSDLEFPRDAEVTAKRVIYADAEPRDLAYKVARHLVERAYAGDQRFSRGDGVAVLAITEESPDLITETPHP